ncbi:MAG: hypothetical protein ACOX69_07805 [Coriobacteriales bacterium]
MGGKPVGRRIELGDVVDHLRPLDASCAETLHVVDHQGPLDAGSAPSPATWADFRIEPLDVVDHQGGFDATCAEPLLVVDRQQDFGVDPLT